MQTCLLVTHEEKHKETKYVVLFIEAFRTRVQFPPPPPTQPFYKRAGLSAPNEMRGTNL